VRRTTFAAIVFALAAATATANAAAPTLVYRIDKVTAAVIRGHLVVSVSGAVRSGGWTLPRLHLKETHPSEGKADVIAFLATPPPHGAVVVEALLPITTTAVFPLHYAMKQVTVEAETNAVTATIAPPTPAPATPYRSP
jgi:hypothetical protein